VTHWKKSDKQLLKKQKVDIGYPSQVFTVLGKYFLVMRRFGRYSGWCVIYPLYRADKIRFVTEFIYISA
jgi:hypothetical protein